MESVKYQTFFLYFGSRNRLVCPVFQTLQKKIIKKQYSLALPNLQWYSIITRAKDCNFGEQKE